MKTNFARGLKSGTEFTDYFMVKSTALRTGSNNKQYLDMKLCDRSGELNAKKWDIVPAEEPALSAIKAGDIIKVKAQVTEWQGQTQLRVLRIRKSNEADGLDLSDFIRTAPEKPDSMYAYIQSVAESIEDGDLRAVALRVLQDNRRRLMYYPAAAKNHHAEYAGLLWHMKRMLMNGIGMCGVYPILDPDLIKCGVIIHDMEKLNEIDADENGMASGYSRRGQLLGHIVQGVTMIDELCREIGVPEEKALLLEHMVLSHHYEPEFGSPRKPMFPEAEILHYLDIIDARMYDMEEALNGVEPGSFSERVWVLDNRRIYRPVFDAGKNSGGENGGRPAVSDGQDAGESGS